MTARFRNVFGDWPSLEHFPVHFMIVITLVLPPVINARSPFVLFLFLYYLERLIIFTDCRFVAMLLFLFMFEHGSGVERYHFVTTILVQ